MTIRLEAKKIRSAQAEVKAAYPQGGTIKGWYEDIDPDVEDRQVYESKLFKRQKSMFRRKTRLNVKTLSPDYFTFEPSNGEDNGE